MSNAPTAPDPSVIMPSTGPALGDNNRTEAPTPDIKKLYAGRELNELEVNSLAISRPIKLVVAAGPVLCGKTTLLTSLYESFQHGPVSGCLFGGSDTLPAFERRCFFSRLASNREVPETERTPIGDARYLHLRVCPGGIPHAAVDLLFTDVSGEAFERARDSRSECQRLTFLKLADHLLLLLDGQRLAQKDKRWGVVHESMSLLQSCLDAGMLMPRTSVNIIWTKTDYVIAAEKIRGGDTFREDVRAEFKTRFGTRVPYLDFSQIAARPTETVAELPFAHGLPELMARWTENSNVREKTVNVLDLNISGKRESEFFGARHFQIMREIEPYE